jgi:hypothetical protein
VSDLDLDLDAIQRVVDLGPYRLLRCEGCRGINLGGAQTQCGWCGKAFAGAPQRAPAAAAQAPRHPPQRARRGPSGSRPRPRV